MTGALAPRLVLVTRESEYEGLLARHATRGQAAAFLRRRAEASQGQGGGAQGAGGQTVSGPTLEGLDAQREHVAALLTEIRAALPKGWRVAHVRRAELDRFLFGPEDVVVAVGQDGLVANLAKYLSGQPVIGVNADPARNAGVLVPHTAAAAAAMLPLAAAGTLRTVPRTMIRAELDDGQALLALNEIFVGHASHQSARYSLRYGGREEAQSSSGLIVASGTGATGWALSIARATGVAVALRPDEAAAVFLVREPWPSRATGTALSHGRLDGRDALLVVSRMNEGGVVFADGMEGDRLDFAWGRSLRVSVAERTLRFVPGAEAGPSPAPARVAARRREGAAGGTTATGAGPGVAGPGPWSTTATASPAGNGAAAARARGGGARRGAPVRPAGPGTWRRRLRWAGIAALLLPAAVLLLVRACVPPDPISASAPAVAGPEDPGTARRAPPLNAPPPERFPLKAPR